MEGKREKKLKTELAVKKASGDKSVYNFIAGGGVVIAALGIGLMFTGVGLPIGLGIFALGELIAIGAGYVSHQAQKDLDSLAQKQSQTEDVQRERPQVVEHSSVSKAQASVREESKQTFDDPSLDVEPPLHSSLTGKGHSRG